MSLLIITALMPEAVPLINFYRLNKQKHQMGQASYHHYCNDNIELIVCGMGRKKMAKGLAAFLENSAQAYQSFQPIINIGIAGSKSEPIGALVWVDKIAKQGIASPLNRPKLNKIKVVSLRKPNQAYLADTLFDMEAETILQTLQQKLSYFKPERFFCAKVISDNPQQNLQDFNRAIIGDLIQSQLPEITNIINIIQHYQRGIV